MKVPEIRTTDLTVSRMIAASPEDIYDVWLDPKSPGGPWHGAERVILNAVVDGLFYHAMTWEGITWSHYGRFIHLDRGRRIEHTWVSQATKGLESVVLMTMSPKGNQTEVTLRHSGVPDDELGRQHEQGWGWILSAVAERLETRGVAKASD
jgi:uncharacterized protein YndB with AHSA1/START domain